MGLPRWRDIDVGRVVSWSDAPAFDGLLPADVDVDVDVDVDIDDPKALSAMRRVTASSSCTMCSEHLGSEYVPRYIVGYSRTGVTYHCS